MSFWSSQKIRRRAAHEGILSPYSESSVKSASYELALGDAAFVTSNNETDKKQLLELRGQIVIPRGQFALLITKEIVHIPNDVIAFISIKAGIKFRGLVNVSGFHVDPGFNGRLKFSVYNAGGRSIVLERDSAVFLIWFADLDEAVEVPYAGEHQNQMDLTPKDIMESSGELASPAVLKSRLDKLEHSFDNFKSTALVLLAAILVMFLKSCADERAHSGTSTPIVISLPQINAATNLTNPVQLPALSPIVVAPTNE